MIAKSPSDAKKHLRSFLLPLEPIIAVKDNVVSFDLKSI
jgi:hypothetical protein